MKIDSIGYKAGTKICPFYSGAINRPTPDGKGLISEVIAGQCIGAGDGVQPPCVFFMTAQKTCLFWGLYQLLFFLGEKLENIEKGYNKDIPADMNPGNIQ
jgi:hypothetical protein